MHSLPPLISDLALILIVAGLVTVLFKRLKQPLVLGYIVAGFLAGPHMPYMPTVQDHSSIETWSSIGVIFLMFSLGLEFSIKKIAAMGMRPILAAAMVMGCMIGVGGATGRLFDWSSTDSLFLGGMLAMSSTTIIYKAFDDLGLRRKRFAGEVLSVLILEDILGILLMVILSATAVSQQFEGGELVKSLLSLGFFLVLWFVVGIYVVPAFLRRARAFINDETLLVVSIGLCFVLVVLADRAGYSSAFGAFIMGSILSETLEAEKIEHLVSPVKDLFGAIFFVSVGMMVDPGILVAHWGAVLVITLAVLGGQMVFGTLSFVVAGHPLRRAMNCGFSLAQIGEFAFIIAALGVSLKVTSPYLYPIVVAVSIITTFLTPYMIRLADPAYGLLSRRFGHWFKRIDADRVATERATATSGTPAPSSQERRLTSYAGEYVKATVLQTLVYGVLIFATVVLSFSALLPVLRSLLTHWVGNAVTGLLTLWFVSVFVRPVVMRKHNSSSARAAYPLLGAPTGGHLDGRAFAAGRLHPLLHHRISFALRLVLSSGGDPLAAAFHPALAAHQVPKHPHRAAFPSKPQSARNGLAAKHAGQLCGSAGRPRYAPGTAHAADFHPLGGANAAIARPRSALRCARGGRVARRPAHQHPRRLHPPVSGRRVGGDRRRLLLGKLRRANAECDRCSPRRRPCRSQLAPFAPARLASLAVGGHHRGRERHSRHLRLHAHRF